MEMTSSRIKSIFERCLIAPRNGFVGLRPSVSPPDRLSQLVSQSAEAYTTADDH